VSHHALQGRVDVHTFRNSIPP